jgi:hypothetical protein
VQRLRFPHTFPVSEAVRFLNSLQNTPLWLMEPVAQYNACASAGFVLRTFDQFHQTVQFLKTAPARNP